MPDCAVSNLNLCLCDAEVRGDVWGNQMCAKRVPEVCMQMCLAKRPSILSVGSQERFFRRLPMGQSHPLLHVQAGLLFSLFCYLNMTTRSLEE